MRHLLAIAFVVLGVSTSEPPRFRLASTDKAPLARGWVQLVPAVSPFAISVSSDGRIVYDLEITVRGLPPISYVGDYAQYEAWLATPNLDVVRRIGTVRNDSTLRGSADWNKFTVIITAEPAKVGPKWSGAVVMVGRSPSSLMQSFADHPFYNSGAPPF